jgi:hypothetical protein
MIDRADRSTPSPSDGQGWPRRSTGPNRGSTRSAPPRSPRTAIVEQAPADLPLRQLPPQSMLPPGVLRSSRPLGQHDPCLPRCGLSNPTQFLPALRRLGRREPRLPSVGRAGGATRSPRLAGKVTPRRAQAPAPGRPPGPRQLLDQSRIGIHRRGGLPLDQHLREHRPSTELRRRPHRAHEVDGEGPPLRVRQQVDPRNFSRRTSPALPADRWAKAFRSARAALIAPSASALALSSRTNSNGTPSRRRTRTSPWSASRLRRRTDRGRQATCSQARSA